MATKPTDLPEWATDETNNTEPSAGQKASGWTNAQVPPSSYFNWFMFTVWLWIEWLNSAEVDFGAATVRADDVIVDDDLTVTGEVLDDLDLVANKHVRVSGTGEFKHGDRVLNLSAMCATGVSNYSYNGSNYMVSTGLGSLFIAIPLHQGDRIKSVTYARSGDGAADIDLAQVSLVDETGAITNLGSTTEANPGAYGDTTIDVADTTLGAGDTLVFNFSVNAANLRLYSLRVTYDRP